MLFNFIAKKSKILVGWGQNGSNCAIKYFIKIFWAWIKRAFRWWIFLSWRANSHFDFTKWWYFEIYQWRAPAGNKSYGFGESGPHDQFLFSLLAYFSILHLRNFLKLYKKQKSKHLDTATWWASRTKRECYPQPIYTILDATANHLLLGD